METDNKKNRRSYKNSLEESIISQGICHVFTVKNVTNYMLKILLLSLYPE